MQFCIHFKRKNKNIYFIASVHVNYEDFNSNTHTLIKKIINNNHGYDLLILEGFVYNSPFADINKIKTHRGEMKYAGLLAKKLYDIDVCGVEPTQSYEYEKIKNI